MSSKFLWFMCSLLIVLCLPCYSSPLLSLPKEFQIDLKPLFGEGLDETYEFSRSDKVISVSPDQAAHILIGEIQSFEDNLKPFISCEHITEKDYLHWNCKGGHHKQSVYALLDTGIIESISTQQHYLTGASLAQIKSSDTYYNAKKTGNSIKFSSTKGGKKGINLVDAQKKGVDRVFRKMHQFFPDSFSASSVIKNAALSLYLALEGIKGFTASKNGNHRFHSSLFNDGNDFDVAGYYEQEGNQFSILTFFPSLNLPTSVFPSGEFLHSDDDRILKRVSPSQLNSIDIEDSKKLIVMSEVPKANLLKKIVRQDLRRGEEILEIFRSLENGLEFSIPLKDLIKNLTANTKDGFQGKTVKILQSRSLPVEKMRKDMTHGLFGDIIPEDNCAESYILGAINRLSLGNVLLAKYIDELYKNDDSLEQVKLNSYGVDLVIDRKNSNEAECELDGVTIIDFNIAKQIRFA